MSSPVGHSLIGLSIANIFNNRRNSILNFKFIIYIFLLSVLPDFDLIPILFLGIEKGTKYHQIYTHNLLFAFLIGLILYVFTRNIRLSILSFTIILSHILMDILVTDYREPIGVLFFYPFWAKSFNIGILPGINKTNLKELFSYSNLRIILIEFILFLPVFLFSFFLKRSNLKKIFFYDNFSSHKKWKK